MRKFEGNPAHPGSRGRNCAKGPATINQMYDPERILHPMRRVGERGSGQWEQVTWERGARRHRRRGCARPSRRTATTRSCITWAVPARTGSWTGLLKAWGVDGHNSHTNICSAGARTGYAMWMGHDRPSADFANARFILLLSSHLETGHYFNPHAQRIMEGKQAGAKLATIDPRLSNTASMSDIWLSPWPGTEAAILLAIARAAARVGRRRSRLHAPLGRLGRRLDAMAPGEPRDVSTLRRLLKETYAGYTRRVRRRGVRRRRRPDRSRSPRASPRRGIASPRTPGGPPDPATRAAGRWPGACGSSTS